MRYEDEHAQRKRPPLRVFAPAEAQVVESTTLCRAHSTAAIPGNKAIPFQKHFSHHMAGGKLETMVVLP